MVKVSPPATTCSTRGSAANAAEPGPLSLDAHRGRRLFRRLSPAPSNLHSPSPSMDETARKRGAAPGSGRLASSGTECGPQCGCVGDRNHQLRAALMIGKFRKSGRCLETPAAAHPGGSCRHGWSDPWTSPCHDSQPCAQPRAAAALFLHSRGQPEVQFPHLLMQQPAHSQLDAKEMFLRLLLRSCAGDVVEGACKGDVSEFVFL